MRVFFLLLELFFPCKVTKEQYEILNGDDSESFEWFYSMTFRDDMENQFEFKWWSAMRTLSTPLK